MPCIHAPHGEDGVYLPWETFALLALLQPAEGEPLQLPCRFRGEPA